MNCSTKIVKGESLVLAPSNVLLVKLIHVDNYVTFLTLPFCLISETCTGGMEWQDCGSACPLTCANYSHPALCTRQCVPGCSCPQGTVLDGEEYVPFSECPDYISMFLSLNYM